MTATSVQTVMPESETLLPFSAANAQEHTIQTTTAAAGTSKTHIGRVVGVLAGVLAVVTLGAAPMLLATGTHLRKVATEPPMLHEIVDATMQKYSRATAHGSLPHEDCSQIGCCAVPGHQCYKKNDHWAGCRASCTPGIWEDDHPGYRTPWSCEPVGSGNPPPQFPELTHMAVNNNGLMEEGLCLAESARGEPVRFVQCASSRAWYTRGDFGNFDLWFSSGQARDYGAAIRPAHCPQSVAEGSTANAEEKGMCENGWGLQRSGPKTDFKIELTKDGSAYGLCLTSAEMREGDHAIWMRCDNHVLSFRTW